MKPAWNQLGDAFAGSKDVIIVDVDCTKDNNKDLCQKYGVQGYPTVKYFSGSTGPMGDKYEGGRTFDDMKAFADENLGPSCSNENIDLCNDEQKAMLEKANAMSADELTAAIKEKEDAIEAANTGFKSSLEALQAKYEGLVKDKDAAVAAIQPELRMFRAAAKATDDKDEL
jgi:protein disulfide-isomerase A6